jgi:hypothetical protein
MPVPIVVAEMKRDEKGDTYFAVSGSSQKMLNDYHKKVGDDKKVKLPLSGLTEKKVRSIEQNNYYWGVVLEILADHCGYIGPGEKEDLHNELRSMFLVYIGKLGEPCVQSTTKLDTEFFEKYLEAVRTFALNFHQCRIPMPNEVDTPTEEDTYRKL